MPRSSPLDHGNNMQLVAELYVRGASREEIAEAVNVNVDSISRWLRTRSDLNALIHELSKQRTSRILRKIDSAIEARLENTAKLDLKDLLAIRRELVPKKVEVGGAGDFDAAEMQAWAALDAGEPGVLEPGADYDAEGEVDEDGEAE